MALNCAVLSTTMFLARYRGQPESRCMGTDYVREAQNALSAAIAEILHFTAVYARRCGALALLAADRRATGCCSLDG